MRKLALLGASLGIVLFVVYLVKDPKKEVSKENISLWEPRKLPDVLPKSLPEGLTREEAKLTILSSDVKEMLYYLASMELEGRMSGKMGNKLAAEFIAKRYESAGIQPYKGSYFQRFRISRVNPGPKNEQGDDFTSNIIGIVPGTNGKAIVLGAHMDHIGYGPRYSRWGGGRVHPGADDNASGTTMVLEVAEAFGKMNYKPKHTLIFICFSGEEMGLIGSNYYCNNPYVPLSNTTIMINADMIGRLSSSRLGIGGHSKFKPYISKINGRNNLQVTLSGGVGGGSDHYSFYKKGVPVLNFYTGQNRDYHTPTDTSDKINCLGVEQISRFIFDIIYEIDQN